MCPHLLILWHKHHKCFQNHCFLCVYPICLSHHWHTDNPNNTSGEHPVRGDMSKHTSCVIAILIIIASIQRSQALPHLLCLLTWHLPDNGSHLFIHLSANTPGHCCVLPPHSLWWELVSLLLFLMEWYHSTEQQTVCSQKAQNVMFGFMTSCPFLLAKSTWGTKSRYQLLPSVVEQWLNPQLAVIMLVRECVCIYINYYILFI